jgi:hypothetical protein
MDVKKRAGYPEGASAAVNFLLPFHIDSQNTQVLVEWI